MCFRTGTRLSLYQRYMGAEIGIAKSAVTSLESFNIPVALGHCVVLCLTTMESLPIDMNNPTVKEYLALTRFVLPEALFHFLMLKYSGG